MYFEVFSVDYWDRHVLQGYGYSYIGSKDVNTLTVKTWRPKGDYRDQLRSYFIGGSQELEDLSYIAIPDNHMNSKLTKYNMFSESSGSIAIRVNCLTQKKYVCVA
jgi:Meckel syndrome type 1 protein